MTGRRVAARRTHYVRRRMAALVVLLLVAGAVAGWVHERLGSDAVAMTGSAGPAHTPSPGPAVTSSVPTPATPSFDTSAHSVTDPASPWVIVNKAHPLAPIDYAPASLATVEGKQVSPDVVPDLQALLAAAQADDVHLTIASAYRSYTYQRGVHDRLIAQQGKSQAETVSAQPGYSEHQTGLAIDFGSSTDPGCTLKNCYADTVEGRWLEANAGRFGFLHRYTAANTAVTGYASESWHFRWVGRDLTAAMAAKGITTLEEFFGVTGGAEYASPR